VFACLFGSAVAEGNPDPGKWADAPSLEFEPVGNPRDGELRMTIRLEKNDRGYVLTGSTRRMQAGQSQTLPECEARGTAKLDEHGFLNGTTDKYDFTISPRDLPGGVFVVQITDPRQSGSCAASGNFKLKSADVH